MSEFSFITEAKKIISGLLILMQTILIPVESMASQNSVRSADAKVPAPHKVVANRTRPSVTDAAALPQFSKTPTDKEIFDCHVFDEPLVPVGISTENENVALAGVILSYAARGQRDNVTPLTRFLDAHPVSVWRAGLLTNLGLIYRKTGFYSRALDAWSEAWGLSKSAKESKARAMAERAGEELARLTSSLGRTETLKPLLRELEQRDLLGSGLQAVSEIKENLWEMEHHPETSFKCGPYALANLLALKQPAEINNPIIDGAKSTPSGFSMAEVLGLSQKLHLDYQPAKRSHDAEVLVPSLIHWKSGHYAAIVGRQGENYLVKDPTFGRDVEVSRAAINDEGSGYFLVPSGDLPKGWETARLDEIKNVHGRGTITAWWPWGTSELYDQKICKPPCCPVPRMAIYNAFTMLASLIVTDSPVGYRPPVGPAVEFTVSYHQLEATQPANLTYSNLGSLWVHNWMAYVTIPATFGQTATVNLRGGGMETYLGGSPYFVSTGTNQGNYATPQVQGQAMLYALSPNDYERRLPDGSKEVYSATPDGAGRIFLTQLVDPHGNAVSLQYDSNERLVSLTDASGLVTTFSYGLASDKYKITKVTDPYGRFASFTYNSASPAQLITITDVYGLQSQFTYGTSNAMTGMTTPYGNTTFAFSDNGNVRSLQITDPMGAQERLESWKDATGIVAANVPSQQVPQLGIYSTYNFYNGYLQYRNTFYWDKNAMADAPGNYTKAHLYHWLHSYPNYSIAVGIVESEQAALENRVWYLYPIRNYQYVEGLSDLPTKVGRVLDDGTSQIYTFGYNSLGHVTESTDPLGRNKGVSYATNNIDPLQATAFTGTASTSAAVLGALTYYPTPANPPHLPATIKDASDQTSALTYNARGQILTATDPLGNLTTNNYDSDGNLTTVTGPNAATWKLTYDGYGRVQTTTNPDGYTLNYSYDALDRVTMITYPDGTSTRNSYTNLDLTSVKDRNSNVTGYTYDADRHLISVKDANSHITSFQWCTCGALSSMTDPNGNVTTWTRDVMGRPTAKTYADGSKVSYTYENTTSRLASSTDAKSQTTTYTYFLDNHIKLVSTSGGKSTAISVGFTCDPTFDRVTSMTDGTGTTSWTYNPYITAAAWPPSSPTTGVGRISNLTGPLANSTIAFTYDQLGRELSHSINGSANQSSVAYDALGRVTTLTNPLGTFTPTYVSPVSARLASMAYPNKQSTNYGYFNAAGDLRLQEISNVSSSSSILSKFDYTYDSEGKIQTWTRQSGSGVPDQLALSYDPVYQLTWASDTLTTTKAAVGSYAYSYDPGANRTSEKINSATTTSTFNAVNELTKQTAGISSTSLTYDLNGNLLNDGVNSYTWDARNRLIGITYPGGASTQLTYDGLDRCVKIVELSSSGAITSTRQFVWLGIDRAEERNASNAVAKRFYPQGEQISGAAYFFTHDHLGSVREMTNSSGDLGAAYNYDPYGRRTVTTGADVADFGFTGHFYHQPSSLHIAPYRAYNADFGRWLSRDPIKDVEFIQGSNLYRYAGNSPPVHYDVDGRFVPLLFIAIVEAGAIIAALNDEYQALRAKKCPNEVAKAFGRGIVSGAAGTSTGLVVGLFTKNPFLVGASAGAVSSSVDQWLAPQHTIDPEKLLLDSYLSGIAGPWGEVVPGLGTVGRLPNPFYSVFFGRNGARLIGQEATTDIANSLIGNTVDDNK